MPTPGKFTVASADSPWPRRSMITPSPNAGCSTSSPMRRPRSWASLGCRRAAPAGGERGVDDPLAVGVGRGARRRRRRRRRGGGGTAAARPSPTAGAGSGGRTALRPVMLPCDSTSSAGDLLEEPRRRVVLRRAEQAAAPGVGDVEALPGPGDADVGEPALLLQLVGLGQRPGVREDALLDADRGTRPGTPAPWPSAASSARPGRRRVDVVGVGDERDLLEELVDAG